MIFEKKKCRRGAHRAFTDYADDGGGWRGKGRGGGGIIQCDGFVFYVCVMPASVNGGLFGPSLARED